MFTSCSSAFSRFALFALYFRTYSWMSGFRSAYWNALIEAITVRFSSRALWIFSASCWSLMRRRESLQLCASSSSAWSCITLRCRSWFCCRSCEFAVRRLRISLTTAFADSMLAFWL